MPQNKSAVIRYRIIDACLRNKYRSYPSLQEIIDTCEDKLGVSVSASSIQKDLTAMRKDHELGYFAPIRYSSQHQGYYYEDDNYTISSIPLTENEIDAIEFATITLEQFKGVEIFEKFSEAIDKILNVVEVNRITRGEPGALDSVDFEKAPYSAGAPHLGTLVEAIKKQKVLQFNHHHFNRDESSLHIIHPYLLKEFRNRWYLVGWHEQKKDIRTFGLDRISDIEVIELPYLSAIRTDFDAEEYFNHVYGITYIHKEPEIIEISLSPLEGKYVKSQPIHHTQQVVIDNEKETRITLHLIPNYELMMRVLGFGDQAEVIRPESFRKEINDMIRKMRERYK